MGLFGKKKARLAAEQEAKAKRELADRIIAQTKEQTDQWLVIVGDCVELVNTTKSPEVFFQRYSLLLELLGKLSGFECTGIFAGSKELPSEARARVEALFPEATNDFIDRSYEAEKARAEKLKTEKGKQNAIERFFNNMERYADSMPPESVDRLEELKNKVMGETSCDNNTQQQT
jgi:hypothetical protein